MVKVQTASRSHFTLTSKLVNHLNKSISMATNFYESEECFRRYEVPIIQALIAYPEKVQLEPSPRSTATDSARCRDAIASFRRHRWPSHLDPAAYEEKLGDLAVWIDEKKLIWIGSREVYRRDKASALVKQNEKRLKSFMAEAGFVGTVDEFVGATMVEMNKATQEEIQAMSLEEVVDLIENSQTTHTYTLENTPFNLAHVIAAIGDRLNVAYRISGNSIIVM